ncbi:MAPEG family protein [Rickettsiales bacterium]|nr:MAPEG family protein [Rickettsiales bacterium]
MLSNNQKSVVKGIVIALIITIGVLLYGILVNPFNASSNMPLIDQLQIMMHLFGIFGLILGITIARLAKYRFFSSNDIDGGGLTTASSEAKLLQSELQNTLEQTVLAIFAYLCWIGSMPSNYLSVLILNAGLFLIGRILFIIGYDKGAKSRALGFALTFYPSMITLLIATISTILDFL